MSKKFTVAAVGLLVGCLALNLALMGGVTTAAQNSNRVWEQHAVETNNQVAYGGFIDAVAVHKFARNVDSGSAAEETVWNAGADYVWPTAAETVELVSSDADDTAAGTGARTLRVIGLDASYDDLQEDIALAGLTPVTTTNLFLRVFRSYVVTSGTTQTNEGAITAEQSTSALVLFDIAALSGQTTLGVYTVADGKTLLVNRIFGSVGRVVATAANIEFRAREESGSWRTGIYVGLNSQGSTFVSVPYPIPLTVTARTDIELRVGVTANGSDINAGFDGYLINIQ